MSLQAYGQWSCNQPCFSQRHAGGTVGTDGGTFAKLCVCVCDVLNGDGSYGGVGKFSYVDQPCCVNV